MAGTPTRIAPPSILRSECGIGARAFCADRRSTGWDGTGPRLTAPPSADAPPATPGRGQKVATAKTAEHPRPSPVEDGLSDERVRQLYAQYLEAKRRRKESTAAITYEALARRLRESGAKLMQKHGRAVDFEVNEKDGKTILKPILK